MPISIPTSTPDYELIVPASGTGITSLSFTNGVTLAATSGSVDTGSDARGNYITITPGAVEAIFQATPTYFETPLTSMISLLDCAIEVGGTVYNDAHAGFSWGGNAGVSTTYDYDAIEGFRRLYTMRSHRDGFVSQTVDGEYGRIMSADLSTRVMGRLSDRYDGETEFDPLNFVKDDGGTIDFPGPPHTITMQTDTAPSAYTVKIYGARLWYAYSAGLRTLRQRQTLLGNAGGHALRQRHNGGNLGGHLLRQRQTGL